MCYVFLISILNPHNSHSYRYLSTVFSCFEVVCSEPPRVVLCASQLHSQPLSVPSAPPCLQPLFSPLFIQRHSSFSEINKPSSPPASPLFSPPLSLWFRKPRSTPPFTQMFSQCQCARHPGHTGNTTEPPAGPLSSASWVPLPAHTGTPVLLKSLPGPSPVNFSWQITCPFSDHLPFCPLYNNVTLLGAPWDTPRDTHPHLCSWLYSAPVKRS